MAAATKLRAIPDVGITPRQVRAWIEGRQSHFVQDVPVTPEIAKVLLEYNREGDTNRRISVRYVRYLAETIRNGQWENTGEPIVISDAKLLNDGQHRLLGLIESGAPSVTMDLRFGIARHAFAATNAGRKRSGADALGMLGLKNSVLLSSMARMAITYEKGLPEHARDQIGNGDIVQAVERWPDLTEAFKFGTMLRKPFLNTPLLTLAFFAQRVANEASVYEFFEVIQKGEGRGDNPPHMLREAFLRDSSARDHSSRIRLLALSIIAWNAWQKPPEQPLKRLSWRSGQKFPVVEGLKL